MTYNRSTIMKAAWEKTRWLMENIGYSRNQLRQVFRNELVKAWRAAKEAARLAARSVASLEAEITALENRSYQGTRGGNG